VTRERLWPRRQLRRRHPLLLLWPRQPVPRPKRAERHMISTEVVDAEAGEEEVKVAERMQKTAVAEKAQRVAPKHRPQLPPSKLEQIRSVQPRQLARARERAATMASQRAPTAWSCLMEAGLRCPHPPRPKSRLLKLGSSRNVAHPRPTTYCELLDLVNLPLRPPRNISSGQGHSHTIECQHSPRNSQSLAELVCPPLRWLSLLKRGSERTAVCPRLPPLVPSLKDLMDLVMTMGRVAAGHKTELTEFVWSAEAMPILSSQGKISSLPVSGGCGEERWRIQDITSSLWRSLDHRLSIIIT